MARARSSSDLASSPSSSIVEGIDAQRCPRVVCINRFEMENKLLLIVMAEKFLPIQEPDVGILQADNLRWSEIVGEFDAIISHSSPSGFAEPCSVVAEL